LAFRLGGGRFRGGGRGRRGRARRRGRRPECGRLLVTTTLFRRRALSSAAAATASAAATAALPVCPVGVVASRAAAPTASPTATSLPAAAAATLTPILLHRGLGWLGSRGRGGLNDGRARRDQLDAGLEVRVHFHDADLRELRGRRAVPPAAGAAAEPGAARWDASSHGRLHRSHRRRRRRRRHRRVVRLIQVRRAPGPGSRRARPLPPPLHRLRPVPPPPALPPPRRPRPASGRRSRPRERSSRSCGGALNTPAGCAAAPGTPAPSAISYCPLSSLLRLMSPLWAASTTNFEKRENPASFSSNVGSISCITCFRRSERMTSLCAVICFTASTTSSQGSRRTYVTSLSLVNPA